MTVPDDATRTQIDAADPGVSTWLSANAGSGKTRVLIDRVARLLLGGTPPQNILCLTYTKAAAGEMQNRLFRTLGGWAMMSDDDLDAALSKIGAAESVALYDARTLFARAIETPGGLKIQTIHSFCAALLRQFPLEAGVSPGFAEMDESAQRHLLAEVLERLAEEDPEGSVSGLARLHSGHEIEKFVAEIVGKRAGIATSPTMSELLVQYGAPGDLTGADVIGTVGMDAGLLSRLGSALKSGSTTDIRAADQFTAVDATSPRLADVSVLESVLLTGSGANVPFTSKAGSFPTKGTRAGMDSGDLDALDGLMDRVEAARPLRLALEAAERTLALHRFADHLLPAYEAAKAARGWLDFDDLIERATALLSDSAAGAWVRYRLDWRIDHILVDESQDTSPAQWRVIESLASEFGVGEGARGDVRRTLFVVGDKKQSIYSFQGADVAVFDAMHGTFGGRLEAAGGLRSRALLHSFRSSPAILRAVDACFDGAAGLGETPRHIAYHDEKPGRVDLWPLVEPAEKPEEQPWFKPVDLPAPDNPSAVLSRRIAAEIKRMLADQTALTTEDGRQRRITAGDILILVRGRSGQGDLFHTLIRALKAAGLPVAGADVMRLDQEIAVQDLRALLAFLALPEDDLSLATVLRSPLFGWSEDALYRLAHDRGAAYLWETLRERRGEHGDTLAVLDDLRGQADFFRPYDLLERVLVRHDGRRKLVARLGPECGDAIDEMLSLALAYERQEVPSLTGFLAWLDGEANEVKRPTDQSGGAIRVMTVHGAKGLEAPVVILPDTMRPSPSDRDTVPTDPAGVAHWQVTKDARPGALRDLSEMAKLKAEQELERLLYVAMTRSESWLIVCGAGKEKDSAGSWHAAVRAGLEAAGAAPCGMPTGEGLRLETGDWSLRVDAAEAAADAARCLPGWARDPAPPAAETEAALSPSDLGGAKALPGEGRSEEEALRHGRQVHLLLEHLSVTPPEAHGDTAVALLAFGEDAASEAEARAMAAEVSRLLADQTLGRVFSPDALTEVEITAAIPHLDGRRIHGVIDRLVVEDDRVLIVDFKTNAVVPETPGAVPDGILRQMAAYRAAVAQIYPGRVVETAILWTSTGTLMILPA